MLHTCGYVWLDKCYTKCFCYNWKSEFLIGKGKYEIIWTSTADNLNGGLSKVRSINFTDFPLGSTFQNRNKIQLN